MFEIFSDMTDGVCVFDVKGYMKYINSAASKILGLNTSDSYIGKRIVEIIPIIETNDRFMQVFLDFIASKKAAENLIDLENEDGSIRHVRVSVNLFESDKLTGEKAILMLLTDYTELLKVRDVLERYTSKEIAKAALEDYNADQRGGSLVDATVMFCDIRGYTALSGEVPATTLVEVINHHFSVMDRIIGKYDGTVMEFLGDGILASFGVPGRHDDHAYRAVACALEMQNAMSEVREWNTRHGISPFEIGIGINSGLMIAGNIGSKKTMKYQCIGQQVNLAGRIESYSVGGQILISKSTYDNISADVEIKSIRKVVPKGTTTELEIYDVCGVGGEYSVSLEQENEKMVPLKSPMPITFCMVNGKKTGTVRYGAAIWKISDKGAVISTQHPLELGDNIMISYNGEVYAKVTSVGDGEVTVRFTSISLSN